MTCKKRVNSKEYMEESVKRNSNVLLSTFTDLHEEVRDLRNLFYSDTKTNQQKTDCYCKLLLRTESKVDFKNGNRILILKIETTMCPEMRYRIDKQNTERSVSSHLNSRNIVGVDHRNHSQQNTSQCT